MISFLNLIFSYVVFAVSWSFYKFSKSFKKECLIILEIVKNSNKTQIKTSPALTNSLIIIEDRRFFKHGGADFYSIVRAMLKNIFTKRFEGASTITQQLVRNITERREISYSRKSKEILLSVLVDRYFSKNEIFYCYLQTYKISNCIGVSEFCKIRNFDFSNLSFNQSIEIAARFKYPNLHDNNYARYLKRIRTIENKLLNSNATEVSAIDISQQKFIDKYLRLLIPKY